MKVTNSRRQSQRGALAMTELALAVPILFSLIFGTMTFAHATFVDTQLSYSARAASRWASVRGGTSATPATSASVQTFARAKALGLDTSNIAVTTTWSDTNKTPGSTVTVDLQYTLSPLLNYIGAAQLRAKSSQVITR